MYRLGALLLLALLAMAAYTGEAGCTSPCSLDIVIAVDSNIASGPVIGDIQDGVKAMIDGICGDGGWWLGLVEFNNAVVNLTPTMTPVTDATKPGLKSLVDSITLGPGRNLGNAIVESVKLLATGRPEAGDILVIISTGENTTGPDPIAAADSARDGGVAVIGIYMGDPGTEGDEVLRGASDIFINGSTPGFNITEALLGLNLCSIHRPTPVVGGEAVIVGQASNAIRLGALLLILLLAARLRERIQ